MKEIHNVIDKNISLKILRRRMNNGKCENVKLKNGTEANTSYRAELLDMVMELYAKRKPSIFNKSC